MAESRDSICSRMRKSWLTASCSPSESTPKGCAIRNGRQRQSTGSARWRRFLVARCSSLISLEVPERAGERSA